MALVEATAGCCNFRLVEKHACPLSTAHHDRSDVAVVAYVMVGCAVSADGVGGAVAAVAASVVLVEADVADTLAVRIFGDR